MNRTERLLSLLHDSPQDSFLQHALALEYIKQGNDAAARKLFEEILEREPSYLGSYYQLAQLLERLGEADIAVDWYKKGMDIAESSNNTKAYHELRSAWEELTHE
ncbi:MAG TPA: tetratricopeptide repeat protein [Agriterribacter sp.]|nr:tetratricopeptide repeat protein [Agriterribacter sp.]